jgi:uncharacterized repeat protein (TIGR03803 family)
VTLEGELANANGAVYEFRPTKGIATPLYSFHGQPDGKMPQGQLVSGNGMLYGTTTFGGTSNYGTAFSVNPTTGAETVLYSFTLQTGYEPTSLIYQDGMLYGVAYYGGPSASRGVDGFGTVFKINPASGAATVLYAFTDGADGEYPNHLIYRDGLLYATTAGESTGNGTTLIWGTIDSVSPQTGAQTVIYSFKGGTDGSGPGALAARGDALYGTTLLGGTSGGVDGTGFGTLFKLDLATGAKTLLHKFTGGADGANPEALAYEGGAFYGTTRYGGNLSACDNTGCGTVFKFAP